MKPPTALRELCLFLVAAVPATLAASLGDNANCDCFLTNGTNAAYYAQHMFFDFRTLSEYAGVPKQVANASRTDLAAPSSDYFTSDDWTDVWDIQSWDNSEGGGKLSGDASVLMVNSPENIYIQESDNDGTDAATFLTMRTKRLHGFQTAAEFESTASDYHYVSLRMFARTTGSPGAVSAMFTYRASDTLADVQEADIEILTDGPRDRIQYTNQPSYTDDSDSQGDNPEATRNATLPRGLRWTDWAVHRLDWTPERSVWYVNGEEVASIAFQTPKDPAGLNFNVWSDGGSWSGNMSLHGEAFQQIQWIEVVYNTTGEDARRRFGEDLVSGGRLGRRGDNADGCRVVCSIDERDEMGSVAVLWESTAAVVRVGDGLAWSTALVWGTAIAITLLACFL